MPVKGRGLGELREPQGGQSREDRILREHSLTHLSSQLRPLSGTGLWGTAELVSKLS